MRIKKRVLRKILSLFASILLLVNYFTPYLLIVPLRPIRAQEEVSPTIEPTSIPTETAIPTPIVEVTPTAKETPIETITPTEIPTLTPTEAPSVPSPPSTAVVSTEAVTPTPTEAPNLLSKEGTVTTDIVESYSCRADSLNGCLATDKADYAPTDVAVITGHGFLATTIYTIKISSKDEPAVNYENTVTTDDKGSFTVSYQLDGNYRPNYLVELKDSSNQIVASVTFTDSLITTSATVNGGNTTTVYSGGSITIAVTATVDGINVWQTTGYKIATALGSHDCQDTADHTSPGTFTESFTVSAPTPIGTYNVYIRPAGASCNSQVGTDLTLTGAVTVISDTTPPTCPVPTLTSLSGVNYLTGNTIYYSPITSSTGSFKLSVAATDVGLGVQQVSFPTIATFTGGGNIDTSSPYEGTYNWFNASSSSSVDNATITCSDNSANTSTSTFNLRKDATQPTLTTVTLDDYNVKDGSTINVTSDGSDAGSGIGYCHAFWSTNTSVDLSSDTDLGDLGNDCDGTITVPAGAGTYYVKVRAGDNVGYYPNPVASAAVIVDNTAPTTTDDAGPGTETFFTSKTVVLTPTDTGGSGIDKTYYYIGVAGENPDLLSVGTVGTSVVVTCPGVASCTKLIFYASIDNSGNLGGTNRSHNVNIINDLTPPTTTDNVDGNWHNNDVTVTLTCNDTGGGSCTNTYYTTDGTDPDTSSSIGTSFTLSSDGDYTIKYFSEDSSGNAETVKTAANHVKIDKTNPSDPGTPTANVSSPTNQTPITWSWSVASDALSGVKNYIWNLLKGLTNKESGTTTDISKTIDVSSYGDGDFSFDVQTEDEAGNKSGVVLSTTTTVDTIPPVITIDSYDTSWTNGDITVTASTNEGILNTNSHTFTANGSFDFVATDAAGNVTTETVTISNIDTENPAAPSVTRPADNGYITSSVTQKFIWTASTDSGSGLATTGTYQYQIDDNSDFSSTLRNFSQAATSKTLATPLADGIYYIQVRAKDAVGNYSSWSTSIKFTVDSTAPNAPNIISSSHTLGVWNLDKTIDVSWSASDSSGIAGYSYQWNLNSTTNPNTVSEGTNTTNTSGNRATSQSIYFHLRAVDEAGNWSSATHYGPFWVEATNPTSSWTEPLDGEVLSGTVNLQADADDVGSGLKFVLFRYQPSGGVFTTVIQDTSSPYSANWDTTGLTDGSYVLRARAEDNSGRYDIEDINVTIDNTPPQLTSAYTRDLDGNGKIDTIELNLNETINHSLLALSGNDGWSVDGYTVSKVDTNTGVDDTTLLLQLIEGLNSDTGNRPNISYTKQLISNSTHDMEGNQLESVTSYGTDDGAKPVVLSAETQDGNNNGKIDAIKLTLSENIDDTLLVPGTSDGWVVDGYDGESIATGDIADDNILLLNIDEGISYDVDVTPQISYSEGGTRSTHDLAGNQLADYIGSTIDNAAPTTPVASPVGDDYHADQSVTLTGESGAEIRYTTDGTTPTSSTGTVYISPILIGVDTVLKAIAVDSVGNVGPVMTETYGIAPLISGETSSSVTSTTATVTWTTDDPSTSRVVYDTVSHSLGAGANYGYANSTVEDSTKVTSHTVGLTGLTAGTTYYYRTISHGSPESIGDEKTFATTSTTTTTSDSGTVAGASTSSPSAPVCNDIKPRSAPVLISAVAGTNSVTLTWSKASDPVSYYLMTFGTSSGAQTYGNPNIGNQDTTSYTVSGLSGGATYYFKVRAGNGCMPGDFSNELSSTPGGGFVEGIPAGFEAGVLGEATKSGELTGESIDEPTPTTTVINVGMVKGIQTIAKNKFWKYALPIILIILLIVFIYYFNKKSNS